MIEFDKVTTRGGDRGESSLYNGERRRKDDPLFEAMGDVDELSSQLGVVRATAGNGALSGEVEGIQATLLQIGAQIATPKGDPLYATLRFVTDEELVALEKIEKEYLARTSIGDKFVLSGQSLLSAQIDVARAVCRRAERRVVSCIRNAGMIELAPAQRYLNRLSDFLFIVARHFEQAPEQAR